MDSLRTKLKKGPIRAKIVSSNVRDLFETKMNFRDFLDIVQKILIRIWFTFLGRNIFEGPRLLIYTIRVFY